jgi:ADP-ribosylglycohydrolase
MQLPSDYAERVYAGVLGKIIGVYLGRPVEGWSYERITSELGEIAGYVHERLGKPLVVTDDDIAGTFTFLRALPDHGCRRDLTPAEIGDTWLNYIIEGRTILWWGGLGRSTEHTAYLRLKSGVPAPRSGSMALNGDVIAQQIGAQIFIDGWGLVAPGDPELAADLARRAASVSHDGEAIYGAQVIAAMVAQAFLVSDVEALIDTATRLIPQDSLINRLINDVREWHALDGDWRVTRLRIADRYGYERYGGSCHIVPNHALVVLALLYGRGDFQRSLTIVNTSGWDTDCNSGNVGCVLGVAKGLAGLEGAFDWRGPVADRLYLPTADGGRAITDAATEAQHVVNAGRGLAGLGPLSFKGGARFHFEFPGSVQGFRVEHTADTLETVDLENVPTHSRRGRRCLAIRFRDLAPGRAARVATATFVPPEALQMPGYALLASPTLYPGQTVRAGVCADEHNGEPVTCRLYHRWYGPRDVLVRTQGPEAILAPGQAHELTWRVGDTHGAPIAEIGLEIASGRSSDAPSPQAHHWAAQNGTPRHARDGAAYLDYLSWDGEPEVVLGCPPGGGTVWRRAWVDGVDVFFSSDRFPYVLAQNRGTGLLMQGTREWANYRVAADITSDLAAAAGVAVRVQGLRRYYALLLCAGGIARLVKGLGRQEVLSETCYDWSLGHPYTLSLQAKNNRLQAWVDGVLLFDMQDDDPLLGGSAALICQEGSLSSGPVRVEPAI